MRSFSYRLIFLDNYYKSDLPAIFMKKITLVFYGLALLLWLPSVLNAREPVEPEKLVLGNKPVEQELFKPLKEFVLKQVTNDQSTRLRVANRSLQANELLGNYVITYSSLISSVGGGGGEVTVMMGTNDTILIKDFWSAGIVVKAKVDFSKGTFVIPNQPVMESPTYGICDLCVCTANGAPDRNAYITGSISATGIITIDTWWGIYVKAGASADSYFGLYYNTACEKVNGKMTAVTTDGDSSSYGVVIKQTALNLVSIVNFANHGKTIEAVLKGDRSFTINSQLAWEGGSKYGDFYTYGVNWVDSTMSYTIKGTGTEKTLSFGGWRIQSPGGYYNGNMASGKIEAEITFAYPSAGVSVFEGDGTQSSPYLIKGLDELMLLAEKVNNDAELLYGVTTGNKHTKTYLNKYFRLEKDIDASEMRLDPIGYNWNQRFAGTFDGNGKTISNLSIVAEGTGYAGFFGSVDTAGVVKNLTLKNVTVKGGGYYVGGMIGRCLGTIENCHAEGEVYNNGSNTGGIAGVGCKITKATFKGTVTGLGGIAGGIVGEVTGAVDGVSAHATVIVGGLSATYTGGGIVGLMYKAAASVSNSYFAGLVDGSLYASDLYLGGIAGQCYNGKISNCFNVGTVKGFGSNTCVGGIAGKVAGSVTDCYNAGNIMSTASRRTGGIIGMIEDSYDIMTGALTAHTLVRSCYTTGKVVAETYQYDPETETRETIGAIYQTAVPVIEHIYFDKQMMNMGSVKYGVLTSYLTSATAPEGFDPAVWVINEGYYPLLKGISDNAAADLSASALQMNPTLPDNVYKTTSPIELKMRGATQARFYVNGKLQADGHNATIEGNEIKLKMAESGTDTLYLVNDNCLKYYFITFTPASFKGDGTEENPFLISTKEDLIKLSYLTGAAVKQYFKDTYFKMTNDIDMEYDPAFIGLSTDASDAHCQFAGHFDGGGYALHRFQSTRGVIWSVRPEDDANGLGTPNTNECFNYQGFIGRLSVDGSLKNLTIASDCKFEFWGYSGALVGYNYGRVENCRNYADVVSQSSTAGGICGQIQKGGNIAGCYNAGNVYCGYTTAGGIAGGSSGTIENCQNDGDITVKRLSRFMKESEFAKQRIAGGIVGSSYGSVIKNVLNTGTIRAYGNVGGIAGNYSNSSSGDGANDIYNAVTYGVVMADYLLYRGAVFGDGATMGKIENVYYDAQLLPYGAASNADKQGIQGVPTNVLTKTEITGLTDEFWSLQNDRYPLLKTFSTEPLALKKSAIILAVKANETTADLHSDVQLSKKDNAVWTLKKGGVFSIEADLLKVPSNVLVITYDTLICSMDAEIMKMIPVKSLSPIPLEGEGTWSTPYLLKSATDWNNFAAYMREAQKTFKGLIIRINNDISFNGSVFTPVAQDGITPFEGILDGNGKVMSEIEYADVSGFGYQALIGAVGASGVISDLTIDKSTFTASTAYLAAFVGKLNGKLLRCTNKATVNTTRNYAGGFVAQVMNEGRMIECLNEGSVTAATGYAGGMAAKVEEGAVFDMCSNVGSIIGSNTVAGIVAYSAPAVYRNCSNRGEVTTTGANIGGIVATTTGTLPFTFFKCFNTSDLTSASFAAGIVAAHTAKAALLIDSCYNTGDIITTASKSSTGTAGIAGAVMPSSRIANSYNTGNIMSDKSSYAGGISGYATAGTDTTRIAVHNCYNTGNIVASAGYGAGISAYAVNYMAIDSCYNLGAIEGTNMLGGIAANFIGQYASITDCWNAGNITGSKNALGGIVGSNTSNATITNCVNMGDVTSTGVDDKTAHSVGGLGGQSGSTYTNCYNTGKVTALKWLGGLVGCPYTGSKNSTTGVITYGTSFRNCYNAGEVAPLDTLVGHFVGETGKRWNYNFAENLYSLPGGKPMATDTIGMLISSTELASLDLGDAWTRGDNYTYPLLKGFDDTEYAKLAAAVIILDIDDTFENISKTFYVGKPGELTWESSSDVLKIDGNTVTIKPGINEEVILTARIQTLSKPFTLKVNTLSVGVSEIAGDKVIKDEAYYSISGVRLTKDAASRESVFIVVRTYDDKTVEIIKQTK